MHRFETTSSFWACCALALATAFGPSAGSATEAAERFVDITDSSGITFEHRSAPEKKYILESMSGGVAVRDFDGDGRPDIYFVNSLTVETADQPRSAPSALYRNLGPDAEGRMRFEDVAEEAGVAYPGWGMGVCGADVDGNGHGDLYVTGVGGNRLYLGQSPVDGVPRFTDATEKAGVGAGGWSAGCGFADYDRDGDLDLFVSRYVEIDMQKLPEFGKDKTCQYRGVAVQCGPRGLPGTGDLLYRNNGDGTFTDVAEAAGVHDPGGYFGLGLAWMDIDQDGWIDLYVANDATPNFLYQNRGVGPDGAHRGFEEVAFFLGVAVSEDGAEQGGMGVAVGDYDRDGHLDLFVANFAEEYNALYRNEGEFFADVSFRSKTGASSLPFVGWGTAFVDLENDGWEDLLVTNGHVYPQLDNAKLGASAPYRQRRLLYRNLGAKTSPAGTAAGTAADTAASGRKASHAGFEEVGSGYGGALARPRVSRGMALGDLDSDGRMDAVINDLDGKPQVLLNRHESVGHWLQVRLVGKGSNRDAIGAVITARAGEQQWTRLVQSGTSYLSQHDVVQHFGLGPVRQLDSLRVQWPDGSATESQNVAVDRSIVVEQE